MQAGDILLRGWWKGCRGQMLNNVGLMVTREFDFELSVIVGVQGSGCGL